MKKLLMIVAIVGAAAGIAAAADVVVTVNLVSPEGVGKAVGKITAVDTDHGLLLKPELSGLPAGLHGFHLHEHGTCEAAKKENKMTAAHAAGGHFDPDKTGKHLGPYEKGHLGDLPPLYVGSDGKANLPILAPRLKTDHLKGHALMIHDGGDNYSDQPKPLGGGGDRIACGVLK